MMADISIVVKETAMSASPVVLRDGMAAGINLGQFGAGIRRFGSNMASHGLNLAGQHLSNVLTGQRRIGDLSGYGSQMGQHALRHFGLAAGGNRGLSDALDRSNRHLMRKRGRADDSDIGRTTPDGYDDAPLGYGEACCGKN